jgi:hypothetical protein
MVRVAGVAGARGARSRLGGRRDDVLHVRHDRQTERYAPVATERPSLMQSILVQMIAIGVEP